MALPKIAVALETTVPIKTSARMLLGKYGVNTRYENTKIRKYENTKIRKYENTKIQEYDDTAIPKRYDNTMIQRHEY